MDRLTDQIVTFSQGLAYDDLDQATITRAKDFFIDAVGCALGALSSPPVRIAQSMVSTVSSTTPATVIGTRYKTSPDMASFANGVMIRYLDYNPTDILSCVLATTEAKGGDGKAAILGAVIAYELLHGLRDGQRGLPRGEGGARWDQSTFSLIAAAGVAARQLGLDREQAGHAISLAAVSHMTLGKVRRGQLSHWKGCATANAQRNAVFSALLASEGMTGPNPVFEGSNGFFEAVGGEVDFRPAPTGSFRIMDAFVKWAPCGFYGQGPIEAALELRRQITDLDSVKEVRILTSPHGAEAMGTDISRWQPETRETADHSLPFVVTMAFMEGGLRVRYYDEEYYKRPDVRAFMAKIKVNANPDFHYEFGRLPFSEVAVETASGEVHSARVVNPLGHPERPMTEADYERKFRSLAEPVLTEEGIVRLLDSIRNLEHVSNIGEVLALTAVLQAASAELPRS